jgi:beta-galactosidase
VRIDGGPFQAGVPAGVSASFTVSATAHDVALSLAAPDGWTVTPDGPLKRPRVRPGETFTARWTVTPSRTVQPYPLLRADAAFTQGGTPRAVADARAVRVSPPTPAGEVYVSDLPLVRSTNGWGPVEPDTSNGEDVAGDGRPLTVGGTRYAKGLGTHAPSSVRVWLGGNCTAFSAVVGVDDEVGDAGSVSFAVVGDASAKAHTGVLTGTAAGQRLTVDVTGVRWLDLDVTDGGDNGYSDHADWADARLSCSPDPGLAQRPRAVPDRLMRLSASGATREDRS